MPSIRVEININKTSEEFEEILQEISASYIPPEYIIFVVIFCNNGEVHEYKGSEIKYAFPIKNTKDWKEIKNINNIKDIKLYIDAAKLEENVNAYIDTICK